ncbi:VOC family protein [Chryseobacterium sp. EZn1]
MVKRIVVNIKTNTISKASRFYQDILGLEVLMDHGWIKTLGNEEEAKVQISFAEQGGNDTEVPDLSIEVDNVDEVYEKMKKAGFEVT